MRLAVVADIHDNLRALEAVIAGMTGHAPDVVLNRGDCVCGFMEAGDTDDLIMARHWPTVHGNHGRWLVEKPCSTMGKSDLDAADQHAPSHKLCPAYDWTGAAVTARSTGYQDWAHALATGYARIG